MIQSNFETGLADLVQDLTSADKADIGNAIFKNSFLADDITKTHPVVTGVRNGSLVPILSNEGSWESHPFTDENSCEIPSCNLTDDYSSAKWDLGLIECRTEICLRSFSTDFNIFWQRDSIQEPNVDLNDRYVKYLASKAKQNLVNSKWRGLYFGDTSSTSNLFNGIDGFFAKMEAGATTDNLVEIVENDGATFTDQKFSSGQRVYDILEAMYNKAIALIWSNTNWEFRITKLDAMLLAGYLNGLKDHTCCNGVERLNPDNVGSISFFYDKLSFNGYPIRVMPEWDECINKTSELNAGFIGGKLINPNGKRVNPHRMILCAKETTLIGTENSNNLSTFDIFYEKKDRKVYIDSGAYIGAGVPLNEYVLAI